MAKGYVYIATNPSFKDDLVKIGKTSKNVEERIRALYTTALPHAFELYAWCRTEKYDLLEKQMHYVLEKEARNRINERREFFEVSPEDALQLLRVLASTLEDAQFHVPHEAATQCPKQQHLLDKHETKKIGDNDLHRFNKRWNKAEIKRLVEAFNQGVSFLEIAKILHRTESAIATKLQNLGYVYWDKETDRYIKK